MRYYLYVSTAKLDMLFEQVPRGRLGRVTEAKVDLKVAGVSVQRSAGKSSVYERLAVVEEFLAGEYDIGWMTESTLWFRGDLGMRITGTGDATGPVLMTGTDVGLVVILIGSAHHLVGHAPSPELSRVGHSWLPSLHALLNGDQRSGGEDTLRDALAFSQRLTGPGMWCEFLARQLMRGTVSDEAGRQREVVVATPLYVAMSEES